MDSEINLNYKTWLSRATDNELLQELLEMSDNEKTDAFSRDLEFGTGGLRGVIGAGTNRMNVYTVRRATQGLCNYLLKRKSSNSVAIAFDSRIKSSFFAAEAAGVFSANGIRVHIFAELMPTPMLSYAVRELNCDAGIVITASHNPAKYNGYKVYGSDGCQITLEMAEAVLEEISNVDYFDDVKTAVFDDAVKSGSIAYIPNSLIERFYDDVLKCAVNPEICAQSGLSVIYTPLNGAGSKPVKAILNRMGVEKIYTVPSQDSPDGNFPTCKKPNPEERSAFEKALEQSVSIKPDLLLATDPDCDRVGIAVRDGGGEYTLMTGNEVGCLLLDYILSQRKNSGTLPAAPVVVKTIVTSVMADEIAKSYGAEVINTLTGFKFIGEQIGLLEKNGQANRFVFGFEESYGYLAGSYARD
jgi:phosphoglucomutase